MEERIGTRVNLERTAEAVATGAERIATACPFCRVMLGDGVTQHQADGTAGEDVEVVDVAQLLLESVRRGTQAPQSNQSGGSDSDAPSGADGGSGASGNASSCVEHSRKRSGGDADPNGTPPQPVTPD